MSNEFATGMPVPNGFRRQQGAVAVVMAWALLAFWLAEGGGDFGTRMFELFAGLLFGPVFAIAICSGLWRRMVGAVVFALVWLIAFQVGGSARAQAFNSCVERGEMVREALHDYRQRHGHYPASLASLVRPLPCGLVLRGSLLSYAPEGESYSLSFGDSLLTFTATESEAFDARK